MHSLQFEAARAPRRKLRGKRGYFSRIQRRAERAEIAPGTDAWWDLWHYHADWPGWGNRGWRWREPHLRALCAVFRRIVAVRDAFTTPFQAWILVVGSDAGQDATYLHTPNPNAHSTFPIAAQGLEWGGSQLDSYFRSQLRGTVRVGVTRPAGEHAVDHWVCVEGVGVPIH